MENKENEISLTDLIVMSELEGHTTPISTESADSEFRQL